MSQERKEKWKQALDDWGLSPLSYQKKNLKSYIEHKHSGGRQNALYLMKLMNLHHHYLQKEDLNSQKDV